MTAWTLTEWEWTELPLSPADVMEAQAHLGAALSVEPCATGFRLRAQGVAGLVALPGGTLHLRPKVPALNLLALIDYAARDVAWGADLVGAGTEEELLSLLGALYLRRVERLARGGWVRGYREEEAERRAMRGRWLVGRDMVRPPTHRHLLSCRFDEFTSDVAPNRVLLAALRILERSGLFGPHAAARASALASTLAEVQPLAEVRTAQQAVASDRRFAAYGPALGLARLILEGAGMQATPGHHPLSSLVLRLAPLFEAAITRALAKVAGVRGLACHAQRPLALDAQGQLTVIPDVVLEQGEARLVIDAKYKLPAEGMPPAEDFQQLVTYLACLDTRRGALVLPALGAVPEETALSLRAFGRMSQVRILKVPLGGRASRVGAVLEAAAERLVSWLPVHLLLDDSSPKSIFTQ